MKNTEDPSFYLITSHYTIFLGYTISENDPYKINIRNVQRESSSHVNSWIAKCTPSVNEDRNMQLQKNVGRDKYARIDGSHYNSWWGGMGAWDGWGALCTHGTAHQEEQSSQICDFENK